MNFVELRRGMIVVSNTLAKLRPGRELANVNTSTQKAMMWTGTYLLSSGLGKDPYKNETGKHLETVDEIPKFFDATENTLGKHILDKGLIFTVDTLRSYFKGQIESFLVYNTNKEEIALREKNYTPEQIAQTNLALFNIYTNLMEAKMWLGMELGRIKLEGEGNSTTL